MTGTLGLSAFLFAATAASGEPTVETQLEHFRHRNPNRDLMIGFGPTVGDKVFTILSPSPAHFAPEFGARFVFGSWRYNVLARGAVAPLVPVRGSIAESLGGELLEFQLAARLMAVQHRLVRFGPWIGLGFDQIRTKVELAQEDGGASGTKRIGHFGLELGLELAFPVMLPRADRPWSMDIFLSTGLRAQIPTRSRLRLEDESGEVDTRHLSKELRVLGPFSGAMASARVGLTVHYDLAALVQPRSGQ